MERSPLAPRALCVSVAVVSVLIFARCAALLFERFPPVWPDESLFAEPALRLIERGELATDLLTGLLPEIEHRTYWMPPGYFALLALVFSLVEPGLAAVRGTSLALAVGILALVHAIGRRAGLGGFGALLPASLLALDFVFLRMGLVGRMDALAIACALSSAYLLMGPDDAPPARERARAFAAGLLAGGALLAHPMGGAAGLAALASPSWRTLRRRGPPLVAGAALALLPWLVYAARDPASFAAQFGAQFVRKSARHDFMSALERLRWATLHSPVEEALLLAYWALGLVGLLLLARARPRARVLVALQLLWSGLLVYSPELWYVVYLHPLCAVGLVSLVGLPWEAARAREGAPRTAAATVAACGALLGVGLAYSNLASIAALLPAERGGSRDDYAAYCAELSEALPRGARVLLAVIPDPWLGLLGRRDLVLREFPPLAFPVDSGAWQRLRASSDFVVLGDTELSPEVTAFTERHAVLHRQIGGRPGASRRARVYRVLDPGSEPPSRQSGRPSSPRAR